MAERIERRKPHRDRRADDAPVEEVERTPTKAELKRQLDDLLDEIDEVLEVNAEEFVNAFVQKGGE